MIDEKNLIEIIESYRGDIFASEIVELIKQMPTVADSKWIPCSEQMPPEPNANNTFDKKPVYLVSVKGEDYPHRALWNGRYFMDGFLMLEAVAWMPLPEPPKEE